MKVDYLLGDLQTTFHLSGKFPKKQEIKEDDLENQIIIQVGKKKKTLQDDSVFLSWQTDLEEFWQKVDRNFG